MSKSYSKHIKGLGRKVMRLRKSKNFAQEESANAVGFSRVSMGYIEQGREIPSLKLLITLARKLGVGVEELFKS